MRKLIVAILAIASVCSAQTNNISLAQTHVAGVNLQTGTSYTILASDRSKLVSTNNASAVGVSLPQATGSFTTGFMFWIQNIGAGTATITPTTSTIDGQSSMTLTQYQGVWIVSNGTNWYSTRGAPSSGSGTVTSIATTSPITGGPITSTGTIACASCVTASSPGVGLAHFAGSTQAVTSSAVALGGADVTGTLGVGNGGLGVATLAAHGVVVGNTASPVNVTTAGTIGQCLISNGASSDPTFQSCAGGGAGGAAGVTVNSGTTAATVDLNDSTPAVSIGYQLGSFQASTSAGVTSVSTQIPVFPHLRKVVWQESTGAGLNAFVGDTASGCGGGTHSLGDNTDPPSSTEATSTTNNSQVVCNNQNNLRVGHGLYLAALIKPSATTAVRYCIAFADNGSGGFGNTCSDTMNGLHAVGFMYSTTLSHTKWNCFTNNASSNITTATNPVVNVDTSQFQWFEVIETAPGTYDFYISASDFSGRTKACDSLSVGISSGTTLDGMLSVTCLTCTPTTKNFKLSKWVLSQNWH